MATGAVTLASVYASVNVNFHETKPVSAAELPAQTAYGPADAKKLDNVHDSSPRQPDTAKSADAKKFDEADRSSAPPSNTEQDYVPLEPETPEIKEQEHVEVEEPEIKEERGRGPRGRDKDDGDDVT